MITGQDAADTRAARGEALGDGVDNDNIISSVCELTHGLQRLTAVDKLTIRLVADDKQVVLLGNIAHHAHLFRRQDNAGGVAGVRDHDGAGVLVDSLFDLLAVGVVIAFLGAGRDGTDVRTAGVNHGVVVGIEGLGDQNLVAVVEDALQNDLKGLGTAGRNQNLVFFKVHIQIVVILLDRIDQNRHTGGRGIFQNGLIELTDGVEELLGRLYIGLADVQVVDLLSLCFSSHRIGVEFPHRGKAAFFDLAGELHLGIPPSFVAKAQKSGRIHNFYAQSG